jgi:hypothetical protein
MLISSVGISRWYNFSICATSQEEFFMVMAKAELESHSAMYQTLIDEAQSAEHSGFIRNAIKFAAMAWEHIDGMTRYKAKYENNEINQVLAIDLVLKYAPVILTDGLQIYQRLTSRKSWPKLERECGTITVYGVNWNGIEKYARINCAIFLAATRNGGVGLFWHGKNWGWFVEYLAKIHV